MKTVNNLSLVLLLIPPLQAYIYQDELFFCHLTVREHLTYYALNHLRGRDPQEREEHVNKVDMTVRKGNVC